MMANPPEVVALLDSSDEKSPAVGSDDDADECVIVGASAPGPEAARAGGRSTGPAVPPDSQDCVFVGATPATRALPARHPPEDLVELHSPPENFEERAKTRRLEREVKRLKRELSDKDALPAHWSKMHDGTTVSLQDLPVTIPSVNAARHGEPAPGGSGSSSSGLGAAKTPLDAMALEMLIHEHGASRAVAERVLASVGGYDYEKAVTALVQETWEECGGQMDAEDEDVAIVSNATPEEREEAQEVLRRFYEMPHTHGRFGSASAQRCTVTRIQRVQNERLHRKYTARRKEIEEDCTDGANEQKLWHGADPNTLRRIIAGGFDDRVSNLSGAMGAGTYFARYSHYSVAYSSMAAHNAEQGGAVAAYGRRRYGGGGRGRGPKVPPPPDAPGSTGGVPEVNVRPGELVMALCKVQLGRVGENMGRPNMRKPPDRYFSVMQGRGTTNEIYATFLEAQSYVEYLVHFKNR